MKFVTQLFFSFICLVTTHIFAADNYVRCEDGEKAVVVKFENSEERMIVCYSSGKILIGSESGPEWVFVGADEIEQAGVVEARHYLILEDEATFKLEETSDIIAYTYDSHSVLHNETDAGTPLAWD